MLGLPGYLYIVARLLDRHASVCTIHVGLVAMATKETLTRVMFVAASPVLGNESGDNSKSVVVKYNYRHVIMNMLFAFAPRVCTLL